MFTTIISHSTQKINRVIIGGGTYILLSPGKNKSTKIRSEKMIEQDTIKLLRECDAGIKMGVKSIGDVEKYVKSSEMKKLLIDCKCEHEKLEEEIDLLLEKYQDDGKDPNPIAAEMSWMKTSMKLGLHATDAIVADLMTDGCNMGVKSLSGYLNEYKAADEKSKDITKRLIKLEDRLATDMRAYL